MNVLGRIVLNEGAPPAGGRPPADAAEALQSAILAGVAAHSRPDGALDYARLRTSREMALVDERARVLGGVDPARLDGRAERIAFWINVYNALAFHAVVRLRVRRSVRLAWNFFGRASYRIGPHRLSLDEIEHGVLAATAGAPSRRGPRSGAATAASPSPWTRSIRGSTSRSAAGPGPVRPSPSTARPRSTRSSTWPRGTS